MNMLLLPPAVRRTAALAPLALLLGLAGCTYPDQVTGRAPVYEAGYQPVMGGYATEWPAQPGALWGPEDVPDTSVFQQPLSAYGRWVESAWGIVFVPNAPSGWRPYVNGRWLDNRFWLSNDPWGWATDHYGRWGFDQQLGWVWVPGTQWGPSWVAWREADEVVGWAPIPPLVQWSVGVGFNSGFNSGWGWNDWNRWYGPSWVWVPRSSLFITGFGGRILPWNSGFSWWNRTRWQHSPYWGWNQPWQPGWGWRGPPGQWGNRGWNGRGWNNRGWNGRDWNGRDWQPGQPRRGQPGSVADRIGRDLAGQPGRWNGGQRGDGNWQPRGQRRRDGQPGGQQPGWQQPQSGQAGGWAGNRGEQNNGRRVGGRIAGGMTGGAAGAVPPPSGRWQSALPPGGRPAGGWQRGSMGQGAGQQMGQPMGRGSTAAPPARAGRDYRINAGPPGGQPRSAPPPRSTPQRSAPPPQRSEPRSSPRESPSSERRRDPY